MTGNSELLEVIQLEKYFPYRLGVFKKAYIKAVDNISFALKEGETLGSSERVGAGNPRRLEPYSG